MTAGDAIINILRDKKCYATLETSRNGTTVIQTMGWSNVLNEKTSDTLTALFPARSDYP